MYRVWNFVVDYSLMLLTGAVLALIWANTNPDTYHHLVETELFQSRWIGELHDGTRTVTLHYVINDMLMALFFAIAGKEVWEAIVLKDGALRGRKALTPLFATAGGMLGPIAVYLGLAVLMGPQVFADTSRGWAIPTATDIAFSYLVGRMIFGAGHPAVQFLMLLAIADDAAGLVILALFYPTGALAPAWLLLSAAASLGVYLAFNWLPRRLDASRPGRRAAAWVRRNLSFWPYVAAGVVSWFAFQQSGLHPALGLLPVIPAIPHADHDFGILSEAETKSPDLLNTIEHGLKIPVEVVLLLFGFANAGVEFASAGPATWLVLGGLLIGKPLGITLFGWFAASKLRLGLPKGMNLADLFVVGCIAAIGFTVALFVAEVAFPPGPVEDAAKMGALFSFSAAILSLAAARFFKVSKVLAS